MADEARRAAEQNKTSAQNVAAQRNQVGAWLGQVFDGCAKEFAAGARELGVKPAKRKNGGVLSPKYFTVSVFLNPGGDSYGSKFLLAVKPNGSWEYRERPAFPEWLPPDAEAQIRQCFTNALRRRAEGYKESHA